VTLEDVSSTPANPRCSFLLVSSFFVAAAAVYSRGSDDFLDSHHSLEAI